MPYLRIHIASSYFQSDICIKTVGIVDKNGNCLGKIFYLLSCSIWFLNIVLFTSLNTYMVVYTFRLLPRKIWVHTKVIRKEQCLWLQWRRLHILLGVYLRRTDPFKVLAVIKLKPYNFLAIFVKGRINFHANLITF